MAQIQKITPCLWFDRNAEEAVNHYTSIFPNSRVVSVSHYGDAGPLPKGTVLVIIFELAGQRFMALNGGPHFKFTEAISLSVSCDTQAELDAFWEKLSAGGERLAQGQVRPVLAGRALRDARDDARPREVEPGHGRGPAHEQARYCGLAARLPR